MAATGDDIGARAFACARWSVLKAGDVIASKYRLVNRIGQGGMGSVWHVSNLQTGRDFAIKFLHAGVAQSEDSRGRFLQEARASARINHPNAIDIFDVGETEDGGLYLVMELLDGMSLGDALRSEPPFNARELLIVLSEACTALHAAHAAGVVHRDLKPPNIFLHRDRATGYVSAKVLDFGVSKLTAADDGVATHTGSLLGSPRYMSPEQAISASAADARSDVWSIGVVLFEALTGRFPHDGDSSNNLIIAIATKPPKPIHSVAPHLPLAVRLLVDDCLKPQAERIQSVGLLLDRMLSLLATQDLDELQLARPTVAKGKSRARPEGLMFRTTPGQIPGLATSMLQQHGLGDLARHLRDDGPRPGVVSSEEATSVMRLPATRLDAWADPSTASTLKLKNSSGIEAIRELRASPPGPEQMRAPMPSAPAFGPPPAPTDSQPRMYPPPSPSQPQYAYGPQAPAFTQPMGSYGPRGTSRVSMPSAPQFVSDPTTESISSINVVRGAPSSLSSSPPVITPPVAPRGRAFIAIAAVVVAAGIGGGIFIARSMGSSSASARSSDPTSAPAKVAEAPTANAKAASAAPTFELSAATAESLSAPAPSASVSNAAPSASASTPAPGFVAPPRGGPRPPASADPHAKIMGGDAFK
jgi:serine/threonine protein kinase